MFDVVDLQRQHRQLAGLARPGLTWLTTAWQMAGSRGYPWRFQLIDPTWATEAHLVRYDSIRTPLPLRATTEPTAALQLAIADARCQLETGVIDIYDKAWLANAATVVASPAAQSLWRWHNDNYNHLVTATREYLATAGIE